MILVGGRGKKTMHEEYGDGSYHKVCRDCGFCVECGDCTKFGCGTQSD